MENTYQRSWFSKNWPWVLPMGCCSGCLVFIIISFLGIGTAAFSIFNELKELSPIEDILITVNKNPKAIEALGENIKTNGFPNGDVSLNNNDGDIKFSIDVVGEKGEGTLYVNGIRANKEWVYEDLYLLIKETAEEINLLE